MAAFLDLSSLCELFLFFAVAKDCKKSFPSALCLGGSLGAVQRLLRGRG